LLPEKHFPQIRAACGWFAWGANYVTRRFYRPARQFPAGRSINLATFGGAIPYSFGRRQRMHNRAKTPIKRAAPKTRTETRMANEKSQSVQDVFLNNIRKNKMPVTIFLVNGVKLQGIVTWFDNFSVLLRRDAHSQLVYKHAISTIMPAGPLQLFEGAKETEEA
jgi:host factor-I protein